MTQQPTEFTLDSLLDCVVEDMHREQVLALVREAYDAGRRDADAELKRVEAERDDYRNAARFYAATLDDTLRAQREAER